MDNSRIKRNERRKTMNRTQTEKFSVANNIDLTVVKEISEGKAYYALLKISLLGRNTYCICVLNNGYAFESVGENTNDALELFEVLLKHTPSVEHVFDMITDFRHQKALEEY